MSDQHDEQAPQQEQQQAKTNEFSAESEVDIAELHLRIEALEQALSAAEDDAKNHHEAALRARADMENARRRAESEIDKARKFALERFAGELLSVIDNLERTLDAADSSDESVKPLIEGVEMTLKGFLSTNEKFGLAAVNPQGEIFNPELHQAMSMQEVAEVEPNTVIAVLQKGYVLNGRLLRPAMVMVSRAPTSGVDTQA